MAALSLDRFNHMLADLPDAVDLGIRAETLGEGAARLRLPFGPRVIRPVEVVSGPALMLLADLALWGAVLSLAGADRTVSATNFAVDFLRMAARCDVVAEARVLKSGRRLAMGTVELADAGTGATVAHITATYAIG